MTSDQVEFSTGWTCTARIATRDDAVKFLHNYPSGSLQSVMDTEVRAKLQAEFGLEVTDLPMDELRKNATPHIKTCGRDAHDVLLRARDHDHQPRHHGRLRLQGQGHPGHAGEGVQRRAGEEHRHRQDAGAEEENKRVLLEADGKAKAILAEKKAEADGIKAVADAKAYEIQKAKEDLATYLRLKQIELEAKRTEKWDGKFPVYYMGTAGSTPDLLLQVPAGPIETARK